MSPCLPIDSARLLAALAALGLAGCQAHSVSANFSGIPNPILLGPQERVGAPPSATKPEKIREFETSAYSTFSQSSYATTSEKTTDFKMAAAVNSAIGGEPAADIRVTDLNPKAWANIAGFKAYIDVSGDVVRPARAASPSTGAKP